MKIFSYLFILLLGINSLYGQSRTDLEKKRQSVNQQINKTSQLLNKTASSKKATFQKLNALDAQIGTREMLIQDVAQRVATLDTMIDRKMTVVEQLDTDLSTLKENYKKLIRQLYRYKISENIIGFFWSAKSFNHAYQRWIYVQRLETYRSVQGIFIKKIQTDLAQRINQLEAQKSEKDQLLQQELEQKQRLDQEKESKAYLITKLKRQESKLRADLKRKKRYKTQLSQKIEKAILQQIAAAKEAARKYQQKKALAQTKNNSPNSPILKSIHTENRASRIFAQQKGKLMWPIYQGKIIGYYGQHQHPVFQEVLINNNGIDIQGQYNSVVRNIYEGQVVSVFTIPGYQNAVMVKHGDYYTTYSNVAKVYVKQGQHLKTGGQIGTIGRDSNAGGHLLHFEIWHNKYKENPAVWLKK
jgi:septal ring factor EnvC (AmiA/AmiB activator)